MPKKQTFTSELEQMQVGDKKVYPASRCTSVRSMASMLGFRYNRKYTTESDKKKRTITVIRVQ